jgi:hypothetical protein
MSYENITAFYNGKPLNEIRRDAVKRSQLSDRGKKTFQPRAIT